MVIRRCSFYGRRIRKSTVILSPAITPVIGDTVVDQSNDVGNPVPGTDVIDSVKPETGVEVLDASGLQKAIEDGIQHEADDVGIHILSQFPFLPGIID